MSYWLYQSLPGSKNAKIVALVAIVLAVSALLFFVAVGYATTGRYSLSLNSATT